MAVPFGFSIGDFIATVNVMLTCVKAVRDGRGSSAEYSAFVSELESLEAGLSAIEDLRLCETAGREHAAVEQAVYRCQLCIESFVQTIAGYQRWLTPGTRGLRANIRKIQWAMCKKDDIMAFRNQLVLKCSSITMLLTALQIRQGQHIARLQDGCQQVALTTRLAVTNLQTGQETNNGLVKGLSDQQAQQFEELVKEVCQLRVMVQLQERIPAQVALQNPVVLLDACGMVTPIHLDFINSAEAFLAVLRIRFKEHGITTRGLQKLDNAEYVFRNHRTELSLGQPWKTVFRPGEHVEMSMVFHRAVMTNTCPSCQCENAVREGSETEW